MTEVKPATDLARDLIVRPPATDEQIEAQVDTIHDWRALVGESVYSWPLGFVYSLIARIGADREEIAALRSQVKRCHAIIQDFDALTDPGDGLHEEALKELSGEFCPGACTTACNVAQDEDRAEIARLKAHLDETLYERDRLKAEVERLARPESSDLCPKCKGGKRDIFDANRVCFLCDGTGRAR